MRAARRRVDPLSTVLAHLGTIRRPIFLCLARLPGRLSGLCCGVVFLSDCCRVVWDVGRPARGVGREWAAAAGRGPLPLCAASGGRAGAGGGRGGGGGRARAHAGVPLPAERLRGAGRAAARGRLRGEDAAHARGVNLTFLQAVYTSVRPSAHQRWALCWPDRLDQYVMADAGLLCGTAVVEYGGRPCGRGGRDRGHRQQGPRRGQGEAARTGLDARAHASPVADIPTRMVALWTFTATPVSYLGKQPSRSESAVNGFCWPGPASRESWLQQWGTAASNMRRFWRAIGPGRRGPPFAGLAPPC